MTELTAPLIDRCTAAHELGHAFLGSRYGFPPDRIIVRRILGGGYCIFDLSNVAGEQWWHVGLILAAGRAADYLYRLDQGIDATSGWGAGDDEDLFAQAKESAGDAWPFGGTWESASEEAEGLLLEVWPQLLPLVLPLAAHGQLDSALVPS